MKVYSIRELHGLHNNISYNVYSGTLRDAHGPVKYVLSVKEAVKDVKNLKVIEGYTI